VPVAKRSIQSDLRRVSPPFLWARLTHWNDRGRDMALEIAPLHPPNRVFGFFASGYPVSSSAFDFPTHHSWLRASPRLFWPHGSSSVSNRSCLFDGACLPMWIRFLPPLAPRALPRFHATMAALPSERPRSCRFLPAQLSTVHHDNFPAYPAQPPPTIRFLTFDELCWLGRSRLAPLASI
jgi:hypothetical protein